jgi:4-carboxymuconolactone decarboxylase
MQKWRITMKTWARLATCVPLFFLTLQCRGLDSQDAAARQSTGVERTGEILPPDVHPETLSRMPRAKREDFSTEEEKLAFDRMMSRSPKQLVSRWLGPTGTRLQIPELAEVYNRQINMIREKSGLEEKYLELTVLVATRESGGKSEWLDHEPDGIKLLGIKTVDVVRNREEPNGLEEKQATIIHFGRELFHEPKVSSKTFADMERLFGRSTTLAITLYMSYYNQSALLMRAYDQHTDTRPECVQPHMGCDVNRREIAGTW